MDTFFFVILGLSIFVNLVIFVSSIDDSFIDSCYWIRRAYRTLVIRPKHPRLNLEVLHDREQAPFAIMVPAWKEFSVIAQMIEGANANLDYKNFTIFVGTYINDGETQAEADRMVRRYRNVRRVDVPHPGPTCKADCLNWLIQDIFRHEEETGRTYAGVVIHDSEDVINPLELKVFNYLIDRMDLIQLPVLSLEREWHQLVAGTYQDDFAEWHSKDLVVREGLTGLVPCAGTGMCYSRRAMAALCAETDNAPFNTSTLTEDYDFSFRLMKFGMKQAFVKIPLRQTTTVKWLFGEREVSQYSLLGVREYFPSTFRTAFRQRARWILGISLQGWEAMGWKGDLKAKYFMFRDRKGLFTSLVTILAYVLFLTLGTVLLLKRLGFERAVLPPGFGEGHLLVALMKVNSVFMANRVLQRFIFVRRLYGIRHGLLSIPRVVVNNLINFAATCRAWRLYISHRISGRPLAWDKTAHAIPASAQSGTSKRLGEILVAWHEIEEIKIYESLAVQTASGDRLGQILMERCGLTEALLADAVAFQSDLPRSSLNMNKLEQTQTLIPRSLAIQRGWVPLGIGEEEELLLGTATAPTEAACAEALEHFCRPPKFFILTESETACALAYLVLGGTQLKALDDSTVELLGRYLGPLASASPTQLGASLASYSFKEHGRLALFLSARVVVASEQAGELLVGNYAEIMAEDISCATVLA